MRVIRPRIGGLGGRPPRAKSGCLLTVTLFLLRNAGNKTSHWRLRGKTGMGRKNLSNSLIRDTPNISGGSSLYEDVEQRVTNSYVKMSISGYIFHKNELLIYCIISLSVNQRIGLFLSGSKLSPKLLWKYSKEFSKIPNAPQSM
jgi:hypothetical protein